MAGIQRLLHLVRQGLRQGLAASGISEALWENLEAAKVETAKQPFARPNDEYWYSECRGQAGGLWQAAILMRWKAGGAKRTETAGYDFVYRNVLSIGLSCYTRPEGPWQQLGCYLNSERCYFT